MYNTYYNTIMNSNGGKREGGILLSVVTAVRLCGWLHTVSLFVFFFFSSSFLDYHRTRLSIKRAADMNGWYFTTGKEGRG